MLEEYCIEHRIPYIPYDSFAEIKTDVEALVKGNRYHDPDWAANRNSFSSLPSTTTPAEAPHQTNYFADQSPIHGAKSYRPSQLRTISQRSIGTPPANPTTTN